MKRASDGPRISRSTAFGERLAYAGAADRNFGIPAYNIEKTPQVIHIIVRFQACLPGLTDGANMRQNVARNQQALSILERQSELLQSRFGQRNVGLDVAEWRQRV